jgi:hypothetical protein
VRDFYTKNRRGEMVRVININDFARALRITLTTARDACTREPDEQMPMRRRLQHIRDNATIWVAYDELTMYPFIRGSNVYHYRRTKDGEYVKELCKECTFRQPCPKQKDEAL